MRTKDPFGFIGAINEIPKDKKTIDKLHKILVNKKVKNTVRKKLDGRTKSERLKKWIKEERVFGRRFKISKAIIEEHIRMGKQGYDMIAGLDKRALNHMRKLYEDSSGKISKKHKIIKQKNIDYYSVWRKKK